MSSDADRPRRPIGYAKDLPSFITFGSRSFVAALLRMTAALFDENDEADVEWPRDLRTAGSVSVRRREIRARRFGIDQEPRVAASGRRWAAPRAESRECPRQRPFRAPDSCPAPEALPPAP